MRQDWIQSTDINAGVSLENAIVLMANLSWDKALEDTDTAVLDLKTVA